MENEVKDKAMNETEFLCPDCDRATVYKRDIYSFTYGTGDTAIDISVEVPMKYCSACDLGFLEEEGEKLVHEALCHRLGILNPREIREIRRQFGMSREEFATTTGLGEASLGRWERGAGIQSPANDKYLRILRQPTGSACLFSVLDSLRDQRETNPRGDKINNRFRTLEDNSKIRSEQNSFNLCPVHPSATK